MALPQEMLYALINVVVDLPINVPTSAIVEVRRPGNASRRFGGAHDVILFYSRSDKTIWNQQFTEYSQEYLKTKYRHHDPDGRIYRLVSMRNPGVRPNLQYDYKGYKPHPNGWAISLAKMEKLDRENRLHFPKSPEGRIELKQYLDEMPGTPVHDVWTDINPINSQAQERLGYPTQKPVALLERILAASSNEGDVILDPFCGCGTTIHAAQKLRRQWIGIDITNLAISLIEKRLGDAFPGVTFEVFGTPKDLEGARALALKDKYQFQWWAVSLVKAIPYGGKKKGADSGIDGYIYFKPEGKVTEKAIVSVKGGDNVSVAMVRDLAHVVKREKAQIGVFITLADATKPMLTEAVKEGYYETLYGKYPRIQIMTVQELLNGKQPNIPLIDTSSFKKAQKEDTSTQHELF